MKKKPKTLTTQITMRSGWVVAESDVGDVSSRNDSLEQ